MSDEIRLEGLGVAPGVLETIVSFATESVEGVASVGPTGLASVVRKGQGVEVRLDEEGRLAVSIHIHVQYGRPLRAVARAVQESVSDALRSQVGNEVAGVDVFVDGIVFTD